MVLSPEAHLAAATAWRESLWVDLGIGWCGLSAFLPCDNLLACLPCPNFIEKREQLPVFQEQRQNLIELRMLGSEQLPPARKEEIASAVEALDHRIIAMDGMLGSVPGGSLSDELDIDGDQLATTEHHDRYPDQYGRRVVTLPITDSLHASLADPSWAAERDRAAPAEILAPPNVPPKEIGTGPCVRIAGYWHNSLIEGPGRRSTVKLQGCTIQCVGCITPDSWASKLGHLVPVDLLAEVLLDRTYERNGVSILGGEPFFQPEALLALVRALRRHGCRHILAYSGYTYERLRGMARNTPPIGMILDEIDILIDGPYIAVLDESAGPWTGSGNQRVIDLVGNRQAVRLCA